MNEPTPKLIYLTMPDGDGILNIVLEGEIEPPMYRFTLTMAQIVRLNLQMAEAISRNFRK